MVYRYIKTMFGKFQEIQYMYMKHEVTRYKADRPEQMLPGVQYLRNGFN